MFLFQSEVQRTRAREFDRAIEATHLVVAGDQTKQYLGKLGIDIGRMVNQAFLPNVRHGQVSIPKSKRNNNGPCVVPRLITDGILSLDENTLAPTPKRLEAMTNQLRQLSDSDVDERRTHLMEAAFSEAKSTPRTLPYGPEYSYALLTNAYQGDALFTSRPLVTYDATLAQVQGKIRTGLGLLHEFTHVVDDEKQLEEPALPLHDSALRELRAYRVSAIAAAGCVARGILEAIPDCGVEQCRIQYSIDSDELLNGGFQLTSAHDKLVTQLDEGGVLSFEKRFAA